MCFEHHIPFLTFPKAGIAILEVGKLRYNEAGIHPNGIKAPKQTLIYHKI